jgi:hypothetical protein
VRAVALDYGPDCGPGFHKMLSIIPFAFRIPPVVVLKRIQYRPAAQKWEGLARRTAGRAQIAPSKFTINQFDSATLWHLEAARFKNCTFSVLKLANIRFLELVDPNPNLRGTLRTNLLQPTERQQISHLFGCFGARCPGIFVSSTIGSHQDKCLVLLIVVKQFEDFWWKFGYCDSKNKWSKLRIRVE